MGLKKEIAEEVRAKLIPDDILLKVRLLRSNYLTVGNAELRSST